MATRYLIFLKPPFYSNAFLIRSNSNYLVFENVQRAKLNSASHCNCTNILRSNNTSTASLLDLLLCRFAEESRLHDHWGLGWRKSSAQDLEKSVVQYIHHWRFLVPFTCLFVFFWNQIPQLADVDSRTMSRVLLQMEVSHTHFSKISRVEFVHEDSVVMLTSGHTSTTGMLSVLSDSAMSVADVSPHLSAFLLSVSGLHFQTRRDLKTHEIEQLTYQGSLLTITVTADNTIIL